MWPADQNINDEDVHLASLMIELKLTVSCHKLEITSPGNNLAIIECTIIITQRLVFYKLQKVNRLYISIRGGAAGQ